MTSSAAATPSPADRALRVFALTWLSYASYYLARKNVAVTKTALEDELSVSADLLAFVDTGYLAAYAAGQFAMGFLGDRLGPRRLVGLGMIASAALVALAGAVPAAATILVLFTANGFVQASGWPGNVKAMGAAFSHERRGRVMGLWSTCYQVGGLVAGAVTTWLNVTHGFRAAFLVPAAWVALVGGLVLLFLPEAPAEAPSAERRAAQLAVLRAPSVWSLGATYFCLKLIRYSILFWLPYYLERGLGYARDASGYRSLAFEAGGIVGAIAVGFASDRFLAGKRGLAGLLGCVGLGLAFLLYVNVAGLGPTANLAGLALVGFLLFGPDALISGATAQDLGGKEASATAAGFINGMGSVGAVLQGVVTARVSAAFGWDALFSLFVALSLVAAVGLVPRVVVEARRARVV